MAGIRRKARIAALQTLYEIDAVGHPLQETLQRNTESSALNGEGATFAAALVEGALCHLNEIDALIEKTAPSWPLPQMAKIDKNILRLAIYEILFDNKVPTKAAINEAVELAKAFGGENSARFVNGVLGSVSESLRHRAEADESPEPE
ncbi:MAG: transcription antitermination factor NusB [Chloroflexota bacterium]|nr:MAG: transcription antitermination factor NusB [Chloroflexota bacterium]